MKSLKKKKKLKEQITRLKNKYTQDVVYTSNLYPFKYIDGKDFIPIFNDLNNRRITYSNPEAYEKIKEEI